MADNQPILYSFRRCPYAMRARMALQYAGIMYEQREILLKDKPQSMLDYSAKGTVPVFIVSGEVIDESLDIMFWALAQQDKDDWLENNKQLDLIKCCDKEFKPQLDKYKYSDRHELSESEYRNQALWFLHQLNQQLLNSKYLFSDNISMADIAIFPFIRQFSYVDIVWFESCIELRKLDK
jgi:glutathione S-transferase